MAKPDNNNIILTMEGIYKTFPGVQALENVDFNLKKGEIHAIVGENGAGKSTLIKVLTGVERPDAGIIKYDGKVISIKSPQEAQGMGITMVYQEVNLCTNLTIAENILIGREPMKWGSIDKKTLNIRAKEILQGLDIDLDVTRILGSCPVAIQQMAAIARALVISSAKILILDEPTSSLDTHETEQLFNVMRKLKSEGMGIIFITHFLGQVYEVTDRITILRNGKLEGTYETKTLNRLELIKKMIGRTLVEFDEMMKLKLDSSHRIKNEILLEAEGVGRTGSLEPFDLELHAGEVVGIAGLLGSGRTEMAELLFGVETADSGSMSMDGKTIKDYSPLEFDRPWCVAVSGGSKSRGDRTGSNHQGKYHPGDASQPGLVQISEPTKTI